MEKLKKIKDKIKKTDNIKGKLEMVYYDLFVEFSDRVFHQVDIFNESPLLLNAIDIGNQFRTICKEIGVDPRFEGMINFLNLVRDKDREILDKISHYKYIYKFDDKSIERVPVQPDKFKSLFDRFYLMIDEYHKSIIDEEDKKLLEQDKKLPPVIEKTKDWLNKFIKFEFSEEESKKINDFRKEMTENDKKAITKPLSVREEKKIFEKYAKMVFKRFEEYEERGWYNSIKNYSKTWLQYLDKIGNQRTSLEYEPFQMLVKSWIDKVEDWLGRVDAKYENKHQLELGKVKLLNEEMKELILRYKEYRLSYIKHEEDKRILKLIKTIS